MWETWVQFLVWENPLEKEMAIHSSILAWEIPRTEEPGGLQSMRSQGVRHDLVTEMSIHEIIINSDRTEGFYSNLILFVPDIIFPRI